MVLADSGGWGRGGGEESVGGLLIDMAEDKGDVQPSKDIARAGVTRSFVQRPSVYS